MTVVDERVSTVASIRRCGRWWVGWRPPACLPRTSCAAARIDFDDEEEDDEE